MLIGLHCSKFNINNKKRDSYFSASNNDTKIANKFSKLKFPYKIDTQDFIFFNSYLFVLHHTAYKKVGNFEKRNIEYFELSDINFSFPKILPQNSDLNFPTCFACNKNFLAIGIGGKRFKSKIFIYDKYLILVKVIDVDYNLQSPPSGLLFNENYLIASFFKSNSIKFFDLNNFEFAFEFNNSSFGNPLSLESFNNKIYVSSHIGSKLIELNLQNNKINYINSELLQNPWGLISMKNQLIIINLNLNNNKLSSLVSLNFNYQIKELDSNLNKEGLIIARYIKE